MKIAIAVSGGVDSAVCIKLLQDKGYFLKGFTMELFEADSFENSSKDNVLVEAKKICDFFKIEHEVIDLQKEFKEAVINDFISSYKNGITPNPCVVCNSKIKFGLFADKIFSLGYDFLVSGHYAKIVCEKGKYYLSKPKDKEKDQTYMLYRLSQDNLQKIIFPLADYLKKEVREIAKGLFFVDKKDSQEICFIDDNYQNFLEGILKAEKGNFLLKDKIIGIHQGIYKYTIGQRKNLGVCHKKPLYVKKINANTKNITLTDEPKELYKDKFFIKDVLWVDDKIPPVENLLVKTRYNSKGEKVKSIKKIDKGFLVELLGKDKSIACGQSAVFYDKDILVGGGIIS